MTMNKKIKVLVCLSGGVDSSVTAALLVRAGYDVTAAFMINYDPALPFKKGTNTGKWEKDQAKKNCWINDYRDAVRVSAHLGIPLVRWNFTKEYQRDVLAYMYKEYKAGRTPNPDVLCNQFIKFGVWLKKARAQGFDYLATGHYAATKNGELLMSKDTHKDQTYFLHQLNKEQLSHTLFPLDSYTKLQVRALAKKFKLPTATRAESMGICFVGEVPMKKFLEEKITHTPGAIKDIQTGKTLGKHDGLAFYTIGQRQHLGNLKTSGQNLQPGAMEPQYIVKKDSKTNTIFVGPKNSSELFQIEIKLTKVHWISGQPPPFPVQCKVRLRHGQELRSAQIMQKSKHIWLVCANPEWAVAPGQFAVFYHHTNCLGGGVIA